ncbi:exported hypothetical protein [uncultured Mycobacterium sp.]|uniref:Transmembrane protein n=1 Tax=uncultured Mycobacterium sp. TaxID=171292 RepID=A0A1Y5PFU9_9MYCO|nr:hypothetical protein [Mycolicibacterium aromaticivorans]SBS77554.1 exported hypothetical protein [uncultured Mycobacterium sp.]
MALWSCCDGGSLWGPCLLAGVGLLVFWGAVVVGVFVLFDTSHPNSQESTPPAMVNASAAPMGARDE